MTLPLPSLLSLPHLDPDTHLILSPHLDDGIFSCGGTIHHLRERGERVVIVTIMAGTPQTDALSPLATKLHRAWGHPKAKGLLRARMEEDKRSAQHLGAEAIHWPIPEALYRWDTLANRALYPKFKGLMGTLHPKDAPLLHTLIDALEALGPVASIRAPLGIGNHVDHQIVHQAAQAAFGDRCLFYEDFPYSQRSTQALARLKEAGWTQTRQALRATDIYARLQGIRAYESQVPAFWPNDADLELALGEWIHSRGGEVYWSPPA